MSEPTIEEMQIAIRAVHPNFYHSRCSQRGGSWTCLLENGQRIGYGFGHDGAVKDAYSKLPAKAAPEPPHDGPLGIKAAQKIAAGHLKLSKPVPKAAPASEDEAFERALNAAWIDAILPDEDEDSFDQGFTAAWNARERLDAERGK